MRRLVLSGLMLFILSTRANAQSPPLEEYQPTNGEFDVLGQAVVELLKTHAITNFAVQNSPAANDWQSIITTNLSKDLVDRIGTYAKGGDYNLKQLSAQAQAMLDRADSLHVNFSDGVLNYRVIRPEHAGWVLLSENPSDHMDLPYVDKLEIDLSRASKTNPPDAGDFKVIIQGLEKFPDGWRIGQGIQWSAFPHNVVDAKTQRELTLLNKMASSQPITGDDDPTLLTFSDSLIRFIQHPDPASYRKELLMNSEIVWAMYQKSGSKGPTRKELDEEIDRQQREEVAAAEKLAKLMADNGIDLAKADIHIAGISLGHCQFQGGHSLDQVMGSDFQLKLSIQTTARAADGKPLSGDYCLGVAQIMKLDSDWKVSENIHWESLPDRVLNSNTAANIEFENYVAKYRALPPGSMAPEIHFTSLDGGKAMKLSDLRGKVVVLDFWATWCGPCQEPMADLQTLRQQHPDWKDRVAIIPVSIDDTADIVRKHVNQHGWTNTFNVWAGDGGWHSTVAQTFRVTGVPTSYVINQQGKIVWSGYPIEDTIPNAVDGQLKN